MSFPHSSHFSTLSFIFFFFFFFNDTATTEIYTLSLHDALPISLGQGRERGHPQPARLSGLRPGHGPQRRELRRDGPLAAGARDRKSTRLNSSHLVISYAVFCLKKKKKKKQKRYSQYRVEVREID